MKILPVIDLHAAKAFIRMPFPIYRSDPNYIRPFDHDVEAVFDPKKNPRFQKGECSRWLLYDDRNTPIGRIAAFYDYTAIDDELPTGGCGFFECIDNQDAANLLFRTATAWLEAKGIQAMDGPINFGNRERWWGLLVDGFHPPCYCCNYNPLYYQRLFESFGFEVYFKQFTYKREIALPLSGRFSEKALHTLRDSGYSFQHIDHRRLDKAAEDFRTVYNEAWAKHEGVDLMSADDARKLMQDMKPIIDPKVIWFAYHQERPIGFWVSIPDINQLIVKYMRGKLTLWGKLLFLWNRWTKRCETLFGIVFGVVPDYQRKGVEAALVVASLEVLQDASQVGYKEVQMNWIGDFNPKMMNVVRYVGGSVYKTHHTYRYVFDRTKPFERHPII